MPTSSSSVSPVALPSASESPVSGFYKTTDLADAFAVALPDNATGDPESLARFLFAQQPAWVPPLMSVRDAMVAGFGLKTAKHLASPAAATVPRVGLFRIYETRAHEIILGEDDKHLDFRVSVLVAPGAAGGGARRLVVSTVVQCHNLLGRSYLRLIAPFHRQVVQGHLRRAVLAGWPVQA